MSVCKRMKECVGMCVGVIGLHMAVSFQAHGLQHESHRAWHGTHLITWPTLPCPLSFFTWQCRGRGSRAAAWVHKGSGGVAWCA